jgi:hypothetical protein
MRNFQKYNVFHGIASDYTTVTLYPPVTSFKQFDSKKLLLNLKNKEEKMREIIIIFVRRPAISCSGILALLLCAVLYSFVAIPYEWVKFGIKPGLHYTDAEKRAIKAYEKTAPDPSKPGEKLKAEAQKYNEDLFNNTDWIAWINEAQEREIARIFMDPNTLGHPRNNWDDKGNFFVDYVLYETGVIEVTKIVPMKIIDADFRIKRVLLEGKIAGIVYCFSPEGVGECVESPKIKQFNGWEISDAKIHLVVSVDGATAERNQIESCTFDSKGRNNWSCFSVRVLGRGEYNNWGKPLDWQTPIAKPYKIEIKSVLYPRYTKESKSKGTPITFASTPTPTRPTSTELDHSMQPSPNAVNPLGVKQTPTAKAPSSTDANCTNPFAQITSPPMDSVVKDVLVVQGTATRENFDYYKFEYRPEGSDKWSWLSTSYQPVQNGVLLRLDLKQRQIPTGVYWLKLTVVDQSGNYWPEPCQLRIRVEN